MDIRLTPGYIMVIYTCPENDIVSIETMNKKEYEEHIKEDYGEDGPKYVSLTKYGRVEIFEDLDKEILISLLG